MLNYVITNLKTSLINLWQQNSMNKHLLTSRCIKYCYVCVRGKTNRCENCWEAWMHWNSL